MKNKDWLKNLKIDDKVFVLEQYNHFYISHVIGITDAEIVIAPDNRKKFAYEKIKPPVRHFNINTGKLIGSSGWMTTTLVKPNKSLIDKYLN